MDTIGKKLGLKEKMAYGCGDAASNIIWASTGTFLRDIRRLYHVILFLLSRWAT